ncbi:NAD(P)/FAD-dependent oxidoreductase [Planosporangium thailandense]|uniref:NAD(P)/FAD-dependent oxidoreductase n=1 Tax=Planosporangium thailandense TaxID=765197 RepID=A0ABX0Y0G4_9ACTN|nr:FAD/NAD(P)-binding oxidoreductase [Planosporangium thailandense]NJC71837.1 NAD(P)/FAD-dependent oxidoreductase [Planosporangium thailandense]
MTRSVVVVGAGLAGLRAAEQLRAAGWAEPVTVIGSEPHPPYNRPPLTKTALRDGADPEGLAFRQRPSTADVEWRLGTTVRSADLRDRTVTLDDGSTLPYDGLVIATGVSARRLNLAAPRSWRHTVRTIEDAKALREDLEDGSRVVIIGGGFIGCEVASTAVSLGCEVSVVEPFSVPLEGPAGYILGAEVQRRHESQGVRFRTRRTVAALHREAADGPTTVELDDGSWLVADVVVEAVGSTANTGWLEGQGLDLTNGVLCDVDLHPLTATGPLRDVVAIGDVARFPVPMFGGMPCRIEHWTMPTDMAGHAARSLIAGITGKPITGPAFNPLPTFWSDQYGTRIQSFGIPALGRDDVRVLEGDLTSEAVLGYHRDNTLVGVVLLGMPKQMITYRQALIDANTPAPAAELVREGTR